MANEKIRLKDLVSSDYVSIKPDATIEQAIKKFQHYKSSPDKPSIYYIYIKNENDVLKGIVSIKDLLSSEKDKNILDLATTNFVSVSKHEDMEDVARKMADYDFQAFPVLNSEGVIRGIVRLDDMLEVMEEETSEDIFKKAGFSLGLSDKEVSRSDAVLNSSITDIIKIRLPWLMVALIGGLAAGEVIHGFEESLQAAIALAFFIPVIMDMGGNVGTQASTIFVRGVTLGQISKRNIYKHIFKESIIGLMIGLIVGGLAGSFAYLRYGETVVATVLVISMAFTCVVASLVGFTIPWLADKLGYDPAAVSDPLVTTIKDITALLVYFGSAYLLLGI